MQSIVAHYAEMVGSYDPKEPTRIQACGCDCSHMPVPSNQWSHQITIMSRIGLQNHDHSLILRLYSITVDLNSPLSNYRAGPIALLLSSLTFSLPPLTLNNARLHDPQRRIATRLAHGRKSRPTIGKKGDCN